VVLICAGNTAVLVALDAVWNVETGDTEGVEVDVVVDACDAGRAIHTVETSARARVALPIGRVPSLLAS